MAEEARRSRRGPVPNPDRGTNSGFRVTDRDRFELQVAATFVGTTSLQETLTLAVSEFLEHLRQTPGFVEAVSAAEASQRSRQGVATIGQRRHPDDA